MKPFTVARDGFSLSFLVLEDLRSLARCVMGDGAPPAAPRVCAERRPGTAVLSCAPVRA